MRQKETLKFEPAKALYAKEKGLKEIRLFLKYGKS